MNKQSVEVVVGLVRVVYTNTNALCYLSRCTIGVPSPACPNTGQLDVLDVELDTGNGVPVVVYAYCTSFVWIYSSFTRRVFVLRGVPRAITVWRPH